MNKQILRSFIGLFIIGLLLSVACYAQPKDVKILSEHKDKDGNIFRTIQYYQGSQRITETRIIRPLLNLNAPINPDTLNNDSLMLIINKSRFVLDVYYRKRKIRSYKVVFGPKPQENKKMKGDRCTPEGWYKVQEKHVSGRYNKFIHIDYPNDSAYARFSKLKQQGAIPRDAEIGGDVGIHGVWKGGEDMIDMGIGWTDGCIAMKNTDVDELYRIVKPGARVLIRK